MLIGTEPSEAQNQLFSAKNLAENALEIAIKNAPLDSEMIKALRLTCKLTKAAADGRVKKFTTSESQDSEAVERSGLLDNIKNLTMEMNFMSSGYEKFNHAQNLSRAVGLLSLAKDACSKNLEGLEVSILAPTETLRACAFIIGNSVWTSLKELTMLNLSSVHSMLASPGSFPVLKKLICYFPSAVGIETLCNSEVVGNLTTLSLCWPDARELDKAPATVAAMRDLLQKAINLNELGICSSTFEFFDCEKLFSLKSLILIISHELSSPQRARIDFDPALARPWKKLETLEVINASLKGSELMRIFEAGENLTALKVLRFRGCSFDVDALSCVRRPYLETLWVNQCTDGHVLISKLAQVLKVDSRALKNFRGFFIFCPSEDPSIMEAISEFLSCPCMGALELLSISTAHIGAEGTRILYEIANYCPRLKFLSLNRFGRPAVALFAGYGHMGKWRDLKEIGGLMLNIKDRNSVQETLRPFWPGLKCY